MDSLASTMQFNFCFWNLFRCIGFCANQRSGFPQAHGPRLSFAGHGGRHMSLYFSPRVLDDVFVFLVIRINRIIPSRICAVSSFGFSIADSCFSLFGAAFPILDHAPRPHMIWSSCCLNFLPSPPGPHVSFWRRLLTE